MSNTVTRAFNASLGWPGSFVIQRLLYIIDLATFTSIALRDWYQHNRIFDRRTYRPLVTQIIFTGIDALPTILFLGAITGFIFTFQLISLFASIGNVNDIVNLLAYIIGLEIGPMIAAIILVCRTGSAITVDLGNMKLHREIECLEHLAININDFFIAPRILGTAISQLAISVFFTVVTMVSGILISALLLSPSHLNHLATLTSVIDPLVLLIFLVKNIIFGLVIGATSCYHGLRVEQSPTEVPQQTQRAIVNTLILLFILDGLFVLAII